MISMDLLEVENEHIASSHNPIVSNNVYHIETFGEQDVWICDCEMRVPITINGLPDTTLTNQQIQLDVPALSGINADFTNILFTSNDQSTQIPHWTQTANSTGTVWVNVPSIPPGGTTIYMYFDGCGSEGNPDQVFEYFNDFDSDAGAMDLRGGGVIAEMFQGETVLTKIDDCDPAGAWFSLGFTIDNYTLITRETRHTNTATGCAQNRYGLENPDFDGYGIRRNGLTGADFGFERRANEIGGGAVLAGVSPIIPRDTFVITELSRCSDIDMNFAQLLDDEGNPLVAVNGSIANHNYSGFDRIAIRGGRDYRIDYMAVAKFTCPELTSNFGVPESDGPEAICMDITVSLDASGNVTILPSDVDDGSNDNCDNSLELSLSEDTFTCADLGTNVVELTVADTTGLTALDVCKAIVTVIDNIDPVITCSGNLTVPTDVGACDAIVSYVIPTATDNCSIASINLVSGLASGSTFPLGITTVTYEAEDASGNSVACSFDIEVLDQESPTISCPSDIFIPADAGACTASSVNLGTPITSENCPNPVVSNDAPAVFLVGITAVTWTITDAAGNEDTCIQMVTIRDNENPVITCPSDINQTTDMGACEATSVDLGSPTFEDNCPGSSVSNDAPVNFPLGTTKVTWTVTDAVGNTNTCTQDVIITDDEDPTITCPSDITVDADPGSCEATGVVLGSPLTSDNCMNTNFSNNAPLSFPVGTTNVTWTVLDAAGNSATCIQLVTVVDNEAPMISCPPSITIPVGSDCTAPGMNLIGLMTDDNCGIDTFFNDAPGVYPLGTTMVTWTVIDLAGNMSTCVQEIIALDDTPPMITCPADITVYVGDDCMINNVNLEDPADSDNCAVSTVSNDAPASFNAGVHTVTWMVTDSAGNMASCTQLITVLDSIPPDLICPMDVTLYVDATSCEITSPVIGTAVTDDNCDIQSVTNDLMTPLAVGVHTVTWTASDTSGNMSTCMQTVEVLDTISPMITCPADVILPAEAGACAHASLVLMTPSTSDNCMVSSVSSDAPPSFPLGITLVTWTVTDDSGNSATCTQAITITDDQDPSITCPADIIVSADVGLCSSSSINLGTPTTSDNCMVASVINDAPAIFLVGQTSVTWTVTDQAGNTATCIQMITVTDDEVPTITCPAAITLNTSIGNCEIANPGLADPISDDNCMVSTVSNDAPATFPIGETIVTWTVVDASGNSTSCTQQVTVVDPENPMITCPSDVVASTDLGFCIATFVNIGMPTISDNCPGATVSSDAPAIFPIGMTTVTWTVIDVAGNTATCTQTVTIEDNELPTITCPGPMTVSIDAGECISTSVSLLDPVTDDNCGVLSVTNNGPASYPLGSTTVLWTVTDESGNTATCEQIVIVEDNELPVITCPGDTVISCLTSILTDDLGEATATDNCMLGSITFSDIIETSSCDSEFTINRTWRATDASGNATYCLQTIIVQDNIAPVLSTMPSDTTVTCLSDVPGDPGVTATDNCGETLTVMYSQSAAPMCVGDGTVTNTWTVMDCAGNVTTHEQVVTIDDNIAPVLSSMPSDTTVTCLSDVPGDPGVTAMDNCGAVSYTHLTLPTILLV